jgi:hypothetical protein
MDSCILKSESKSCEMARNYSRSCWTLDWISSKCSYYFNMLSIVGII